MFDFTTNQLLCDVKQGHNLVFPQNIDPEHTLKCFFQNL